MSRTAGARSACLQSFIILIIFFIVCAAQLRGQNVAKLSGSTGVRSKPEYVPNQLLVRFKPGKSAATQLGVHAQVGGVPVKRFSIVSDLQLVQLPEGVSVQQALRIYRRNSHVMYAEPNYIRYAYGTPNDPRFSDLWGLNNSSKAGADIHAIQAWDLSTGSSDVVVGVIDTGVDCTHEDLAANIWSNPADCNDDGQDDDGNGYVDDCHGIDVFNGDSDPMDDHFHGTHVAGTIGAKGNNGTGVVGVNWNVQIAACKFLSSEGKGTDAGAIECLQYFSALKDRGINIVATNNSWGGEGYSQALLDAIAEHERRGILFVAAAANDSWDADVAPAYPAAFFLGNIISVAATTSQDSLAEFSNFGKHTIYVGAPGQDILSTMPGNQYDYLSGTSMATPHVTGAVALIKAQNPSLDWKAIRNLILAGGDDNPELANTVTKRRLNVYGALSCVHSVVSGRLQPTTDRLGTTNHAPITLAYLNIDCARPNGAVQVVVQPTGEIVSLHDDGVAPDTTANDGIYTALWTPSELGLYTLEFPGEDTVQVDVVPSYRATVVPFQWIDFTGTSLNLQTTEDLPGDAINGNANGFYIPFPLFMGSRFEDYSTSVSRAGTMNFEFVEWSPDHDRLPSFLFDEPMVAPFWDNLAAERGTERNVYWGVVGTAPNRQLVVEWRNLDHVGCALDGSETVDFQVVWSENSTDILFNYADVDFGGSCASFDKGANATIGLQVPWIIGHIERGALEMWNWCFVGHEYSVDLPSLQNNTSILWSLENSPAPAPVITRLSPTHAMVRTESLYLDVIGTGFAHTSYAIVDRWMFFTEFVDPTHLRVRLESAFGLGYAHDIQIQIVTPGPGGGSSNVASFTVDRLIPILASISPTTKSAGAPQFDLTVTGSQFRYDSQVLWNGTPLERASMTGNEIVLHVPAADIEQEGTAAVTILNVGDSGGESNAMTFRIGPPATTPFSISVSPSALTGKAEQEFMVTVTVTQERTDFSSAVHLTCSGLPSYTSCMFNSNDLVPYRWYNSTLQIITTDTTALGMRNDATSVAKKLPILWVGIFGPLSAAVLWTTRKKRAWIRTLCLLAVLAVSSGIACGGGGASHTPPPPPPPPVTPSGTHTITITGTSGETQVSTNLSLTIQ